MSKKEKNYRICALCKKMKKGADGYYSCPYRCNLYESDFVLNISELRKLRKLIKK